VEEGAPLREGIAECSHGVIEPADDVAIRTPSEEDALQEQSDRGCEEYPGIGLILESECPSTWNSKIT
jgi:hypothetical protein